MTSTAARIIAALPGRLAVLAVVATGGRYLTNAKFSAVDTSTGMFEIQTVDIRGVPTKVFVNAPPSLRAIWDMSAAFAGNTYLVYEDERITFADAHRMVRSVVRWLGEQGVAAGDRIAIATRNYPEYAIAFWAAQ